MPDDVLSAEPALVRRFSHREVDLGRQHDLIEARKVAQRTPGDLFARPERVHVRGIEEVDAGFERPREEGPCRGFVEDPWSPAGGAVAHASQT